MTRSYINKRLKQLIKLINDLIFNSSREFYYKHYKKLAELRFKLALKLYK